MPKGIYKRKPFSETHRVNMSNSLKGKFRSEITKAKISLGHQGFRNGLWKGDKAGYRALHIWIQNKLGKPKFCEKCKKMNLRHRQYHWANISGSYKRIINDWQRLCVKCHAQFDKNCKRGRPKKLKNKND